MQPLGLAAPSTMPRFPLHFITQSTNIISYISLKTKTKLSRMATVVRLCSVSLNTMLSDICINVSAMQGELHQTLRFNGQFCFGQLSVFTSACAPGDTHGPEINFKATVQSS